MRNDGLTNRLIILLEQNGGRLGGQSETSMAGGSDCSDSESPSLTLLSRDRGDLDKKHHVSNLYCGYG